MARDDVALIQALMELGEERPEFVYSSTAPGYSCQYVYGDQASCLVGQALAKMGVPLDRLQVGNSKEFGGEESMLADTLIKRLSDLITVGHDVMNVANRCQEAQDNDVPWGPATEPARQWLEMHRISHYTEEGMAAQNGIDDRLADLGY